MQQSEAQHKHEESLDIETQKVMQEIKQEMPPTYSAEAPKLDSNLVNNSEEEEHKFDAQVDSLLSILINSVYSSKDYFLRELISNASDAIDKRKRSLYVSGTCNEELAIKIVPDSDKNTITIIDNGIGMSKADLINFLGSIATSGTKEFKKKIANTENPDMGALIGQFGLGFYSAFLVADQVDVITKKEEDVPYIWSSRGPGGFVIAPYHSEVPQGTSVVLHIAERCKEYLNTTKLENIIKAHSAFVAYPIYLYVLSEKTRKVPKPDTDKPVEEIKEEGEDKDKDGEIKEADEVVDEEKESEEVEETYTEGEYKHLNAQAPIWSRNPRQETITEAEYESFYKTLSNDWEKHIAVNHSFIEGGDIEMQVLLFLQSHPSYGVFDRGSKPPCNIKLYVQNVLITSDLSEAVPEWMSCVHGVVSSKDIPVNVSREVVQGKSVMNLIKRVLVKKTIDMFKDLSKDKENFMKFYKHGATNIKLGIYKESSDIAQKLAKFLYFPSSKSEEPISLDEYVSRMAEGQKQIYILTGISLNELKRHPMLEKVKKYEVLYMAEPIDEFAIQALNKYNDLPFQRITSDGLELPGETKDMQAEEENYKTFVEKAKTVLGEGVEKVVLSGDLVESACTIKSGKYSYSGAMEHIMRTQPGQASNPMFASGYLTKKIFEINPGHPIVQGLKRKFDAGQDSEFESGIKLIYETSLLACGYPIENLGDFASKVFNYIETGIKKDCEGQVEVSQTETTQAEAAPAA
ncbi:molecular chaperone HtpG [Nematocida homosporus]|uniref:molecular chaperone HtpG n=1 Tax=Nematocida homosporus TaxID=1912981 RepID=UPI0022211A35|nr:molecular chaperone HtpG [Nematocida homosporus]KAI5187331.1 molecular chaperone HtpG [Nematocida homosporus]